MTAAFPSDETGRPDLSVVVPAFNEAQRLPETIRTLVAFLAGRAGSSEVVVVDDGSSDATVALAHELFGGRSGCSVVELGCHQGKGAAVRAGIAHATGTRIIFMDADLATDLGDLERVVSALDDADVALGSRRVAGSQVEGFTIIGGLAHGGFTRLARLVTGVPVADFQCGFKAFRGPVAKAVFDQVEEAGFAFDVEVLAVAHRMGFRIEEVPVRWRSVSGSHIRLLTDSASMVVQLARIRRRVGRSVRAAAPEVPWERGPDGP